MTDLEAIRDEAIQTARGAGSLLMRRLESLDDADIARKSAIDLVTVADHEAEEHVVGRLRQAFPGHGIIAEEGSADDRGHDAVWYVDPLDGTTNFVHGLRWFTVSLALYREGTPQVAVVHAPALDETFHAVRGRGAFLNQRRLQVSRAATLADSVLCTGFACIRDGVEPNNLANFGRLLRLTQGVRRFGSAALDLSNVAAGRLDGFWELRLSPWDVAAGALIVVEAGGRVTDFAAGDGWLHGGNILASNGALHETIRHELEPARACHAPA